MSIEKAPTAAWPFRHSGTRNVPLGREVERRQGNIKVKKKSDPE